MILINLESSHWMGFLKQYFLFFIIDAFEFSPKESENFFDFDIFTLCWVTKLDRFFLKRKIVYLLKCNNGKTWKISKLKLSVFVHKGILNQKQVQFCNQNNNLIFCLYFIFQVRYLCKSLYSKNRPKVFRFGNWILNIPTSSFLLNKTISVL